LLYARKHCDNWRCLIGLGMTVLCYFTIEGFISVLKLA
jgi:hypothetical protein